MWSDLQMEVSEDRGWGVHGREQKTHKSNGEVDPRGGSSGQIRAHVGG